jgi:hypothetical protein
VVAFDFSFFYIKKININIAVNPAANVKKQPVNIPKEKIIGYLSFDHLIIYQ